MVRKTLPKRVAHWEFQSLGTLQPYLLYTAVKLTRPQDKMILTVNSETKLRCDIARVMKAFGAEEYVDDDARTRTASSRHRSDRLRE